jgi:hypothetical protein
MARCIFLYFHQHDNLDEKYARLPFALTAVASVNRDMRAIMLASMNGIAALAQLYGSALFPAKHAPEYRVAFSILAGTFAVGALLYGLTDVLFKSTLTRDN